MTAAKYNLQLFTTEKEYPMRYNQRNLIRHVIVVSGFILFFLYLFRPFGVNEAEDKLGYLTTCCLHALLPAVIAYGYFSSLNFIRNRLKNLRWTLGEELLHVVNVFIIIGIGGYVLRAFIYTSPNNMSLYYLWIELRDVFLAGSLICSYLIFAQICFNPVSKTAAEKNAQLNSDIPLSDIDPEVVFVKAHVKIDDFYFKPDDLLFAKAEGNYVMLTLIKDNTLKQELKRISLKQLELQLSKNSQLMRCHRAYLVNVQRIGTFSGNSQGYSISFNGTTDKVYVSRAYLDVFDRCVRQLRIA